MSECTQIYRVEREISDKTPETREGFSHPSHAEPTHIIHNPPHRLNAKPLASPLSIFVVRWVKSTGNLIADGAAAAASGCIVRMKATAFVLAFVFSTLPAHLPDAKQLQVNYILILYISYICSL